MANNIVIDTTWVRDRFNLQYNNIFSNQAPGLVDYEISMYLTMAHLEVIDSYANSLDLFEKNRSMLTGYIYDDEITGTSSELTDRGINYQIFELNENYWRILKEYAITTVNSIGIPIKPITYDGFNSAASNPYKKPNGFKGWRLDVNNDPNTDSNRDVKIFFKKMTDTDYITKYKVVYLVTPKSFNLESNSIPSTLTNNPFLTEKVINRAIELALRDFKPSELQNQILINKRSE